MAAKSFVLLKNNNQILPLKKSGTIAVVGPLADSRRNMLGTWSVSGDFDKAVTVLEGIKSAAGADTKILFAKGANLTNDANLAKHTNVFCEEAPMDGRSPEAMIKEAVDAAAQSDVVVAVVGEAADMTGEASSMANIDLQESQKELLKALVKTGRPIVMVLYNGRPMTLKWESENMAAILDVWFGGTEGGNAVGDVLFGKSSPSGKLTTSFPYSVGQIPVYHSMLNTGRPYNHEEFAKFKSNYLDIPNEPLYPFGFGLSYTSFSYSDVTLSGTSLKMGQSITASVKVTNTGSRDGVETVQLYIRDVVGSISRPMKELKGFKKISLKAGESQTVTFTISSNDLKFYNSALKFVNEPGDYKVFIGGNSADVKEAGFVLSK